MDADKKRIWIRGQYVEVTDEVYRAYMQGDRKMRYFENDLKTERFVLDTIYKSLAYSDLGSQIFDRNICFYAGILDDLAKCFMFILHFQFTSPSILRIYASFIMA